MSNNINNEWIEEHESDPRLPTDPDFVEVNALADHYHLKVDQILDMARENPSACLQNTGNPWVDHPNQPKNVYFHEPTLKRNVAAHSS